MTKNFKLGQVKNQERPNDRDDNGGSSLEYLDDDIEGPLGIALSYAKLGLAVVPLDGDRPRTRKGVAAATTDLMSY